jgi:hypothetical protein
VSGGPAYPAPGTRPGALRGRVLFVVRVAWVLVALLAVGVFAAGVPPYFLQLQTACTRGAELCAESRLLTPEGLRELGEFGLSPGLYAAYNIGLNVVFALVWCGMGAAIFWRKSADPMALLAAMMLVTFGAFSLGSPLELANAYPALRLPAQLVSVLGFTTFILFLYVFPDGRFVPRWTFVPAFVWIANDAASIFFPAIYESEWGTVVSFLAFLIPALCAVGSQVNRYRRASDPTQRQQTKWVVSGIGVGFGGYVALVVFQGAFFGFGEVGALAGLVFQTAITALFLAIPLSIGLAVLRSRLWDIDILINRALVYGALTASLALVYLGSVVGLQHVFRALTGGESQLAVVASTLVIAALFIPLRRRVQAAIDHRFYRRKYDAAKTLALFGTKLRDEIELDALNEELLTVVNETMQPAHTSLWLREFDRGARP